MLAVFIAGLGNGALLALIAVGVVLVFKGSKVLNLAQGELGAFALFLSYVALGKQDANPVALLVVTVVLATVLGIGAERLLFRPLVERPPIQGTIVSLGLAVVFINIEFLNQSDGTFGFLPTGQSSYPVNMPRAFGDGSLAILGATIEYPRLIALVTTAIVGGALFWFFTRTKFGLGVVAATSDNTVARILGIPVRKVYRFTWGVGGALAGFSAVVVAGLQGFKPGDMTLRMIAALAAAVIGGLDSVWGAIVGGMIVGVVGTVVGFQAGNAAVGDLAILVLVVLTLLVRPRGLLGGAGASAT